MVTRRAMLVSTAAIGAVVFAATLPGMRVAAQATPPQRRSLKGMDLDDPILKTLRDFVTMMRDPSRNGQNVSWVGYSDIHGSFAVGFNKCPHGNWYFLPWHRSYIRMYEVAARALTGNADFAMPYWDPDQRLTVDLVGLGPAPPARGRNRRRIDDVTSLFGW